MVQGLSTQLGSESFGLSDSSVPLEHSPRPAIAPAGGSFSLVESAVSNVGTGGGGPDERGHQREILLVLYSRVHFAQFWGIFSTNIYHVPSACMRVVTDGGDIRRGVFYVKLQPQPLFLRRNIRYCLTYVHIVFPLAPVSLQALWR